MAAKDVLIIGALVLFLLFLARSINDINDHRDSNPILKIISHNLSLIDKKYGDIPIKEDNRGYTDDKEVIAICIIDPDSHIQYDMNTLMYVALHELSHVICTRKGHGTEFKKTFSRILRKGVEVGIYNPDLPVANTYCGLKSLG